MQHCPPCITGRCSASHGMSVGPLRTRDRLFVLRLECMHWRVPEALEVCARLLCVCAAPPFLHLSLVLAALVPWPFVWDRVAPQFRRPSTMALWARSLQAAGATVDRVLITRLGEWRAGSHHHQVEQQQVDKMSCCVGA